MEEINKDLKYEVLRGPLVDKFKTANQTFHDYGIIKIWPPGCAISPGFRHYAEKIRKFTVREDDVWIITYPKSGTTWTQEMVWLLLNNLDYETAKNTLQTERSPYLEFGGLMSEAARREENFTDPMQIAEMLQSPRCIKSHLPLQLLPEQLWTVKPKIIYVARDPRDVAVSYYHHYRLFLSYTGSCEDFIDAFLAEIVLYGSVWDHILDFWKIRHEPNVMFNTFEEMKKDLPGVVRRTAAFLNCTLTSEQLQQLCKHLSFESMKNNPSVSNEDALAKLLGKPTNLKGKIEPFIRKGEVGSWKCDITPELEEKLNLYTEKKLAGTSYMLSI